MTISKILIHEQIRTLLREQRLQSRLPKLINKISYFVNEQNERLYDTRIRQLSSGQRLYKARVTDKLRLVFSISDENDSQTILLIQIVDHYQGTQVHHEKSAQLLKNLAEQADLDFPLWQASEDTTQKNQQEPTGRYYLWNSQDAQRLNAKDSDLWWQLDAIQQKFCDQRGPIILRGSAGSGKTTIALYRLMSWQQNASISKNLYITYSEKLKNHASDYYKNLHRQDIDVDFYTIDELCYSYVSPEQKPYFAKDSKGNNVGYVSFIIFQQKFLAKTNNYGFSADMLWEEFRGILKGCFYLTKTLDVACLKESEYLDLYMVGMTDDDSLFSVADRKSVYSLFKLYQKWLQKEQRWDDLDLARAALVCIKQQNIKPVYAQMVVDEIQDLTIYHVQILLQLSLIPEGLFLTGDMHQSIYPSRFRWQRLKDQIYHHFQKKYAPKLEQLELNYRSSVDIVNISNTLGVWRKQNFKDDYLPLKSIQNQSTPLAWLGFDGVLDALEKTRNLAVSIKILVPDEIIRNKLVGEDGFLHSCQHIVFTIHESKGLEAQTVLLLGFFKCHLDALSSKKSSAHQQRYLLNLLNVACTRACEELLFVDDELWTPIRQELKGERNDAYAQKLFADVLGRTSTLDELITYAQQLEDNKLWSQAAESWKKAQRLHDYYRCLAIKNRLSEEWQVAGEYYQKAEQYLDAADCFEKADNTEALLLVLLADGSNNCQQRLELLFESTDKISKLGKDINQTIMDAICQLQLNVSPSSLFIYSRTRHQLMREKIRHLQRETHHLIQKSQEAQKRNQDFLTAIQTLVSLS